MFSRARKAPFYQVVYGTKIPTPGAMAYAFESEMLALRPFIGPAIAARFQFRTLQNPQASQVVAMTVLAGLSGINHGQSVLQPLSNPYQS
jgi:hypothetical protein